MTSGLRKAHKYIWLLLAIIIPVVLIFAIKDLNITLSKKNKNSHAVISKENVLKVFENDILKSSLFESHIEIILKTTLKNPSSIVYEMDEKGNKSNVIGQLTTAGIYKFDINNIPKGIIISDDLKNIDITKFSFKWD